jgi:hypothetical protein
VNRIRPIVPDDRLDHQRACGDVHLDAQQQVVAVGR